MCDFGRFFQSRPHRMEGKAAPFSNQRRVLRRRRQGLPRLNSGVNPPEFLQDFGVGEALVMHHVDLPHHAGVLDGNDRQPSRQLFLPAGAVRDDRDPHPQRHQFLDGGTLSISMMTLRLRILSEWLIR